LKPEARGTSDDPRAIKTEQWLVKVRMLDNGRTIQVQADRAQFGRLRENDQSKSRIAQAKAPELIQKFLIFSFESPKPFKVRER